MNRSGRLVPIVEFALLCVALQAWTGCELPGSRPGPSGESVDDEVWTIRCITLTTPDRFQRATAYADALKKVRGLKPELVQVVSDEDSSSVFYGRYSRQYGPTGKGERYRPDHLRDIELVRSLRLGEADVWPFMLASMDVLPTYRSTHPEWNLAEADGYWSLHVAVFYNTDTMHSRRSAAEEYCALLRQQGEEAYYHHGPVNSSVYIGAYPKEAVSEMRRENALTGVVNSGLRIVDPRLLDAQKRFPTSTENGHILYEIVRGADRKVKERIPTPSFAVVMPKAQRQLQQAENE